jgi:hypothetical protein
MRIQFVLFASFLFFLSANLLRAQTGPINTMESKWPVQHSYRFENILHSGVTTWITHRNDSTGEAMFDSLPHYWVGIHQNKTQQDNTFN